MLPYIIQTITFQLFFLLIYDALLKNETFFNWNRLYLLATSVLSMVLPFVKVESFKEVLPQQYIMRLPTVFIGEQLQTPKQQLPVDTINTHMPTILSWEFLFYVGMALAAVLFVVKTSKIVWLLSKNPINKVGSLHIVKLLNSSAAFSFFNYIFLGERLGETEKESILKHEMVHVKQNHTLDLLFFEALRIVFWFNPLVYIYQHKMMALHEFIADDNAVQQYNKSDYYQSLLSLVFDTRNVSFINPFFKQSLIKKRIVMLQKSKSKQIHLLKYALVIPMVIGMLFFTSSSAQKKAINQSTNLDLSQYRYTLKKEGNNPTQKEDNEKYFAFLKAHPEYVGWAVFDEVKGEATFTVHPKTEPLPEGFEKMDITYPDGSRSFTYNRYVQSPNLKENNKQTQKELLQLKEEYNNALEVPFAVIDEVPVFPGCDSLATNEERKKCMSNAISRHVNKNFNTKLGKEYGLTGRQRISVIFKIDNQGHIVDVRSRASHPALEAEAIRVVKTLPDMVPGKHRGKQVTVPYSLPIIFEIPLDSPKEQKE